MGHIHIMYIACQRVSYLHFARSIYMSHLRTDVSPHALYLLIVCFACVWCPIRLDEINIHVCDSVCLSDPLYMDGCYVHITDTVVKWHDWYAVHVTYILNSSEVLYA